MGNIELHERIFGGGLVGSVQIETGLSWFQEQTLSAIRDATRDTAAGMAGLGWGVARMTEVLAMRLDQQTDLLTQSLTSLQAIHETLRTPAKTRSAERVADVAVLLKQGRAARARPLADEAIELDPTSPHAFLAAGWTRVAQQDYSAARPLFEEAMEAATGDLRARAARQAARLTYADGQPSHALTLLQGLAEGEVSTDEQLAIEYDRCLYEVAAGQEATGADRLYALCMHEPAVIAAAKIDLAFADYPALTNAATSAEAEWHSQRLDEARATYRRATDLADLAARAHDDLPPIRGWMNLGLTGARYLRRREGLEAALREAETRLRTIAQHDASSAEAVIEAANETQLAEADLNTVLADLATARREFAEADNC